MTAIHPVSLGVAGVWIAGVLLAWQCGDLSAKAGRLPERWMGIGMACGLLSVALVIAGVWFLPERIPRLIVRLLQIVGMAGAFWAAGTLTRALYAVTV